METVLMVDNSDKMLVRVKGLGKEKFGWYAGKRCRDGEEMYLFHPEDFSGKWMEILKATPDQMSRIPEKYKAKKSEDERLKEIALKLKEGK